MKEDREMPSELVACDNDTSLVCFQESDVCLLEGIGVVKRGYDEFFVSMQIWCRGGSSAPSRGSVRLVLT